jgi:hypothetical protein
VSLEQGWNRVEQAFLKSLLQLRPYTVPFSAHWNRVTGFFLPFIFYGEWEMFKEILRDSKKSIESESAEPCSSFLVAIYPLAKYLVARLALMHLAYK